MFILNEYTTIDTAVCTCIPGGIAKACYLNINRTYQVRPRSWYENILYRPRYWYTFPHDKIVRNAPALTWYLQQYLV